MFAASLSSSSPLDKEERGGFFVTPLSIQRCSFIRDVIEKHQISSVLDFGCGEGSLLQYLRPGKLERMIGVDFDPKCLKRAKDDCKPLPFHYSFPLDPHLTIDLYEGDICIPDKRFTNFPCIVSTEVIEHIPIERIDAYTSSLFGHLQPQLAIITTPNHEFNVHFEGKQQSSRFVGPSIMSVVDTELPKMYDSSDDEDNDEEDSPIGYEDENEEMDEKRGRKPKKTGREKRAKLEQENDVLMELKSAAAASRYAEPLMGSMHKMRHWDHKFEWTRAEFANWATAVVAQFPHYRLLPITGVGVPLSNDESFGFATQIAVFQKISGSDSSSAMPLVEPEEAEEAGDELNQWRLYESISYPRKEEDPRSMDERIWDELYYVANRLQGSLKDGTLPRSSSGEPPETEEDLDAIPIGSLLRFDKLRVLVAEYIGSRGGEEEEEEAAPSSPLSLSEDALDTIVNGLKERGAFAVIADVVERFDDDRLQLTASRLAVKLCHSDHDESDEYDEDYDEHDHHDDANGGGDAAPRPEDAVVEEAWHTDHWGLRVD